MNIFTQLVIEVERELWKKKTPLSHKFVCFYIFEWEITSYSKTAINHNVFVLSTLSFQGSNSFRSNHKMDFMCVWFGRFLARTSSRTFLGFSKLLLTFYSFETDSKPNSPNYKLMVILLLYAVSVTGIYTLTKDPVIHQVRQQLSISFKKKRQ